jgi:lipopolysaccharide/colanic/teichoic acid biosynthesis glycosyltransferase
MLRRAGGYGGLCRAVPSVDNSFLIATILLYGLVSLQMVKPGEDAKKSGASPVKTWRISLPQPAPGLRLEWGALNKRVFDLIVGGTAIALLSPLMLVIGLAVRLDSGGPALFRQERIGRGGRPFRMWKFRSMYVHSGDNPHRSAAEAWFAARPAPDGYKVHQDPRVTRVGRLIRHASLDELPQLLNVIAGQMSLVGPRPAIAYELAYYEPAYFARQAVKPGMTGLWQVLGRDRLPATEMMSLDAQYVRERSFVLDLRILAFTLPALLGHGPKKV